MKGPAVQLEQVRKTYAGATRPAVDAVSLEIAHNAFFTLLGPSGCGKTTLLRLIAGFETPDSGTVMIDGANVADLPPNRRPVNTVFQSYALFPHMTVGQNIAFALEMLGKPRDAIRARVAEMVALLRLDGLVDRRPTQLSGGQQQRVALGRALAPQPRVLLLDEPLSALDLKLRKEMQIELKRLQAQTGITFVFVTHDQEEALTMSDQVAVLRDGELMQLGRPDDIYERPANRFVAEFIGEANFLPAICVGCDGSTGQFRPDAAAADAAPWTVADCAAFAPGARAVLVARPERITLAPIADAHLAAEVRGSMYSGSDLMLHCVLSDDTAVRVRLPGASDAVGVSGTVGLTITAGALRAYPA